MLQEYTFRAETEEALIEFLEFAEFIITDTDGNIYSQQGISINMIGDYTDTDGLNHYVDVRVETTNKRDIFLIDLELISPYLAERPPDRESNWL